jgi:hypothetical protein
MLLILPCRVPGNFHIEARSKHHNINPVMANLSHVVNHLSFGPLLSRSAIRKIEMEIPRHIFALHSTEIMDTLVYENVKLHSAWHHYLKVRENRIASS